MALKGSAHRSRTYLPQDSPAAGLSAERWHLVWKRLLCLEHLPEGQASGLTHVWRSAQVLSGTNTGEYCLCALSHNLYIFSSFFPSQWVPSSQTPSALLQRASISQTGDFTHTWCLGFMSSAPVFVAATKGHGYIS